MKYSVETLPRMDADIKRKVDIYSKQTIKGIKTFEEIPIFEKGIGSNGTNYVIVYGSGTPTENAAELQATYDVAKTMPRYLGVFGSAEPFTGYVGQIFQDSEVIEYHLITRNIVDEIYILEDGDNPNCEIITEAEAKSVRTTVIVAPGDYLFDTAFVVNASGIDIVSLTGNPDVLLNGIEIPANHSFIKGLDFSSNQNNAISSEIVGFVCENCKGTLETSGILTGIYNSCEGVFISEESDYRGIFTNCKLTTGNWSDLTITNGGKIINCINADGNVYSNVKVAVANGVNDEDAVNKGQLDAAALNGATIEYVIAANNTAGVNNPAPSDKHFGIYPFTGNSDFDILNSSCAIGSIVIIKTIGNFTINIISGGTGTLDGQDIDITAAGIAYPIVNTFVRVLYQNASSSWAIIG